MSNKNAIADKDVSNLASQTGMDTDVIKSWYKD